MGLVLLTERHATQIAGILSCFDRMIVQGALPVFCYAEGMTAHLTKRRIRTPIWFRLRRVRERFPDPRHNPHSACRTTLEQRVRVLKIARVGRKRLWSLLSWPQHMAATNDFPDTLLGS